MHTNALKRTLHGYTSPALLTKYLPSLRLLLFYINLFCIEANLGRFTHHFTIHRDLHTWSIRTLNPVSKLCRPTREGAAAAEAAAIVAAAVAIVVEAAVIVAEEAVTVAEAAVIVAEEAVTVAEAAVIVADVAAIVAGMAEEHQAILHHAVPRALTEGRCPSVVVHQATVPVVVAVVPASGEVGHPMFNLAYTCKSNPQGRKSVSCAYILTPP